MVHRMSKPNLMVAPNGARKQKSDHPDVPITFSEIAQTAKDCFYAGADSLHLHIRKKDGNHSLDAGHYKEAISAVGEAVPDMPIQITTESGGIFDVATQFQCLKSVIPEAASISIREMARETSMVPKVYGFCSENNVAVQHILYNASDVALLADLYDQGSIPRHMDSVIFVLGHYQPTVLAQPTDLQSFLDAAQHLSLKWAICAFGQNELACARLALRMGGDIRIGFENNIHLPNGILAKSNAQTVALAAALIKDLET